MAHVGIPLDDHEFVHADCAEPTDTTEIIPLEIHEHQVLGTLLGVGQQLFGELSVLRRAPAAWPGAGDRAGIHPAILQTHQAFRGRADQAHVLEFEQG